MVFFPNAKINLGLNIIEKRQDQYHNIESIFLPIPIYDALEITENSTKKTFFSSTGIDIPSDGKPNLVERAWTILNNAFNIPNVDLDLIKKIPIGAGLGGGSSDAATCILGLNKMFELNIPEEKLLDLTSQLGADCAFFIKNKPVYAKGIGDDFSDLEINLNSLHFVVIYPNIHVSTPNAYKYIIPKQPQSDIRKIVREPVEYWKNNLKNDFEESVFNQYPTIKKIKEILYEAGAVYASMSGSGSTLFGIFKEEPSNKFNKYGQVWQFTL